MNDENKFGLLDRTLKNLRNAWKGIAAPEYNESAASMQPDLPKSDAERLLEQMHACLETRGGEVSARARAAALGRAYLALNDVGKTRFLQVLAENFGVDHHAVDEAIQVLQKTTEPVSRSMAEQNLRKTLEAPRLKLLTQFNALPEGVKFLVDMRADLLGPARDDKTLKGLEHDLKGLMWTSSSLEEFLGIARRPAFLKN
jgi:malonyl-CoA decarboxylase